MPSFQDSAIIFFLALLLFGPKKLPELARQLGKLMGEFRRASNEFRMQMEDELRMAEQAEKQKEIAAIEAAAPAPPALESNSIAPQAPTGADAQAIASSIEDPLDSHPHMAPPDRHTTPAPEPAVAGSNVAEPEPAPVAPIPIATSGSLNIMPPATGLPLARSSASEDLSPVLDAIPHTPAPLATPESVAAQHHQPFTPEVAHDEVTNHG